MQWRKIAKSVTDEKCDYPLLPKYVTLSTEVNRQKINDLQLSNDDSCIPCDTIQGVPSARELSLVDFHFECSTVCPILPGKLAEAARQPDKMSGTPKSLNQST